MQVELKRIHREVGITFIHVTHDQEEALAMADRIAVMAEGEIEQLADFLEVYTRPLTPFVAGFVGEANGSPAPSSGRGRRRLALKIGNGHAVPLPAPARHCGRDAGRGLHPPRACPPGRADGAGHDDVRRRRARRGLPGRIGALLYRSCRRAGDHGDGAGGGDDARRHSADWVHASASVGRPRPRWCSPRSRI